MRPNGAPRPRMLIAELRGIGRVELHRRDQLLQAIDVEGAGVLDQVPVDAPTAESAPPAPPPRRAARSRPRLRSAAPAVSVSSTAAVCPASSDDLADRGSKPSSAVSRRYAPGGSNPRDTPLLVADRVNRAACLLVDDADGGAGDRAAGGVADRAGDDARVALRERRGRGRSAPLRTCICRNMKPLSGRT